MTLNSHTVFVAIGANLGQRATHIKNACRELELLSTTTIVTSFLYETSAAYVIDQPPFLNGVVKISTTLAPENLLKALKDIEARLGRIKTRRYGERTIDLDIILYDDINFDIPILTIPHKLMSEREFVLRPLCDLAPDLIHPVLKVSMGTLLSRLLPDPSMYKTIPLSALNNNGCTERLIKVGQYSRLAGILNVTNDSFSDGDESFTVEKCIKTGIELSQHLANGILDIGGQSSRPGAIVVGVEEEIKRVVPVIQGLRQAGVDTVISVDTYNGEVARAAIEAGADIINDITGGLGDPAMLTTAAQLKVPIVIMHMRGNFSNMKSLSNYINDDVIPEMTAELTQLVNKALDAGIYRWNIVIDPGIGFAKNGDHNIQILSNLSTLFDHSSLQDYPLLVGPSRKRFLGTIAGK
eukprot:Ihof_evm5s25 gene=Ihof_evmTU5s25